MPAYERSEVDEARQLPEVLTKSVTWLSFKPAFDSAFSITALLFLAPILLLVAALIRLDSPGPVLFRQTRTGLNGLPFRIYKFRTMRVLDDGVVVQQAQRGDSRVTRIGRFLRSTSIDELPQLINVLRGEMALVGPRPHAMAHDQYYGQEIPIYNRRFAVRPGLTGWAQVSGSRGETPNVTDMVARVELDLWYVENNTLLLDLKILVQTIIIELSRRNGAY